MRKKHRGRKKYNDEPVSVEKIEARLEERLVSQRLLAEAFLLGKNKYGKPDVVPKRAIC